MTSDFSLETIEDWRQNFISCEIYFKNEDKIKTFSNKLRLTEFVTFRLTLQDILKKGFQTVDKWHHREICSLGRNFSRNVTRNDNYICKCKTLFFLFIFKYKMVT